MNPTWILSEKMVNSQKVQPPRPAAEFFPGLFEKLQKM